MDIYMADGCTWYEMPFDTVEHKQLWTSGKATPMNMLDSFRGKRNTVLYKTPTCGIASIRPKQTTEEISHALTSTGDFSKFLSS